MGPLRDPGTCRWHFTKWSINKKFISIILLWRKFQIFDYCVVVGLAGVGVFSSRTVLVSRGYCHGVSCLGGPNCLHWAETRIDKSGQWGVSFIYPGWKEIREKDGGHERWVDSEKGQTDKVSCSALLP